MSGNEHHSLSTSIGPSSWEKTPPEQPKLSLGGVFIEHQAPPDGRTPECPSASEDDQEQGELGIESMSYDGNFSSDFSEGVSRKHGTLRITSSPSSDSTYSDASTNSTIEGESSGAVGGATAGRTGAARNTPIRPHSEAIQVPGTPVAGQSTPPPEARATPTNRPNSAAGTLPPREIRVVVAGKSGAGKSELINTLLHTEADGMPIHHIDPSPNSMTDGIETKGPIRRQHINDVTICMVDTPGLKDGRKRMKKQLEKLSKEIGGGKADLLIYCVPVGQGMRFDDAHPTIMKVLQDVFGKEVWQQCIVVFTFSNMIQTLFSSNTRPEEAAIAKYKRHIKGYTDRFKQELEKLSASKVEVENIFEPPTQPRQNGAETKAKITAIPAGYEAEDRVLPGIVTDDELSWVDVILAKVAEKCNIDHKEDFLRYRYGEVAAERILGTHGPVLFGSTGGGALVVAGAVVGTTVGVAGGPVGMVLGGSIGATAGLVASTVLTGGIALNRNEDS